MTKFFETLKFQLTRKISMSKVLEMSVILQFCVSSIEEVTKQQTKILYSER